MSFLGLIGDHVVLGRPLPFAHAVALGPSPDATLAALWAAEGDPATLFRIALRVDHVHAIAAGVACACVVPLRIPPAAQPAWDALAAFDGTAAARAAVERIRFGHLEYSSDVRDWTRAVVSILTTHALGARLNSRELFGALDTVARGQGSRPHQFDGLLCDVLRAHLPPPTWAQLAAFCAPEGP